MPSSNRILLLCGEHGPLAPDDCCRRHRFREAVTATGAVVEQLTCPSPVPSRRRPGTGRRSPRRGPLGAIRRPFAVLHRAAAVLTGAAGRWPARLIGWPDRRRFVAGVAGADRVVAESTAIAAAAAVTGVARSRLWVLVRPVEPLFAGAVAGQAAELARLAPAVAGFLVECEPDRSAVERATAASRVRVEVLAPGGAGRPCPECGGLASARPAGSVPHPRGGWDDRLPEPPGRVRAACEFVGAGLAARAPRTALVAGYDLKFAADLAGALDRRPDLAVTVDDWPELGRPTRHTSARLRWADAIFAEWARTSAIWLAQRKRPGQLLVVRLHRFELDSPYPAQLDIDRVDAVVYIAPRLGRRIHAELGWPARKLVYLPNYLDLERFDRPKLPAARFAIGFVGIEWSRKRFDLALDLLAAVRREDHRFRLVVRSTMPWHNEYVWADPAERAFAGECFARIEQEPMLRDAVFFDPPGWDMPRWYQRIGHLASTSDQEGSHASVAEAMAAGAVPVIRPWPGAEEVYGREWIHATTEQAAAAVLADVDPQRWQEQAELARREVRRSHDPASVVAGWADLLHGEVDSARRYFPAPPAAGSPRVAAGGATTTVGRHSSRGGTVG